MFKLLNNCIRTSKLHFSCELKVLKQRQFTSKVVANNVNEAGPNLASATYCFNLVKYIYNLVLIKSWKIDRFVHS